ncbi:MAG: entry exclusion lipoprotein TrbK [Alphaproteobacteria bacterium]|nr:entry exclusion lipoprotein TrbK [Alphaproteobacteria bacterium]
MNAKIIILLLLTLVLVACEKKPATITMPELNAENCKPDNVEKIEPREIREQFSSMCLRAGEFEPSKPKEW